jgi:hypothetical protein
LEWRSKPNLTAYQALLAVLDDDDGDIRRLAESAAPKLAKAGANCDLCQILVRAVPSRKRVASYLQFCGQVHSDNPGVELKGAISRNRIPCILAILAAI